MNERLTGLEHPSLVEDEQAQQQSPDGTTTPAPGTEQVPPSTEAGSQEPFDPTKHVIIPRDDIYGHITRLEREDPAFANVLNTLVGNKARRQYHPRIVTLEEQLAEAQRVTRLNEIQAIPEPERNQRLANDANFRREYDAVQQPIPSQAQVLRVQLAIEETFEDALGNGVPEQTVNELRQKLASGAYDAHETLDDSFRALQRDVLNAVGAVNRARPVVPPTVQSPAPAAPTSTPASTPAVTPPQAVRNPALAAALPDVGGRASTNGSQRYTKAEIDSMTPDQLLTVFPNEGDWERAVAGGLIDGMSEEALAPYQNR